MRNQPVQGNLNPFIIGLLIVAIGLSFGLNTGYAINPARDFGPRLFAFFAGWGPVAIPGPDNYFWIPIVAPLVGGVVGALIYDFTIHKGLEAKGLLPSGAVEIKGEAVCETPGEWSLAISQKGNHSAFGTWNDVDTESLLNNIYADRRRTNARPL